MYYTTGFSPDEISALCEMALHAAAESGKAGWPPCLGLYNSVVVTLSYLRRNRVQAELAEAYGISQPTVSRAISALMPLLEKGLAGVAPTADDLGPECQLIVDGTLLPCWSWASEPGLYSGKHKTTGMNVQVACTLDGQIAWVSDPVPGVEDAVHLVLGGGHGGHGSSLHRGLVDDGAAAEDVVACGVQWHDHGVVAGQSDGLHHPDDGEGLAVDLDTAREGSGGVATEQVGHRGGSQHHHSGGGADLGLVKE